MSKLLITYVSKTGSTKEVAEEIGRILKEKGIDTDVLSIPEVKEIGNYKGVIIGAPVNGFRWLPEAVGFVEKNREELLKIPVAYFMLSYLLIEGRQSLRNKMKSTLDKVSASVKPVSTGMFGGRIASRMPSIMSLAFGIKKNAPFDVRDWKQIRIWANELIDKLNV